MSSPQLIAPRRFLAVAAVLTLSLSAPSLSGLQANSSTVVMQGQTGAEKLPAKKADDEKAVVKKAEDEKLAAKKADDEKLVLAAGLTLDKASCVSQPQRNCRLGDTIKVTFKNLNEWTSAAKVKASSIYLILNGHELKGLPPEEPGDNSLNFKLSRITEGANPNSATWTTLLTEIRDEPKVLVSVRYGGPVPFPNEVPTNFDPFPQPWSGIMLVLLIFMAIGFGVIAYRSDILRDSPAIAGIRQAYSLARCQMAWWFFIVLGGYCYIWLALGNRDSLSDGVLILTGISAATGLSAIVIGNTSADPAKQQQAADQATNQAALQDRLATLSTLIDLGATDQGTADLKTEKSEKITKKNNIQADTSLSPEDRKATLEALNTRLEQLETAITAANDTARLPLQVEQADKTAQLTAIARKGETQNLLFDILRDTDGISFHRFQMACWTVILGVVFISAVYRQFEMPNFSATLLGLMGISSGTYIGFKIANTSK